MTTTTIDFSETIQYRFDNDTKKYLSDYLNLKVFASPVQFIDMAVKNYIEDREVNKILDASKRAKKGEVLYGDLDDLAAKI